MKLEDPDFIMKVDRDLKKYQDLRLEYSRDQDLVVLNNLLSSLIGYICYLKVAFDDYMRLKDELFKATKELSAQKNELSMYRSWYIEDERRKNNE